MWTRKQKVIGSTPVGEYSDYFSERPVSLIRESPLGLTGSRVSLVFSSGFGIIKQTRVRFGIESMRAS